MMKLLGRAGVLTGMPRGLAHFPLFFPQELHLRVAKHLDQVRIDVFDLGGISVKKQNPALSAFK